MGQGKMIPFAEGGRAPDVHGVVEAEAVAVAVVEMVEMEVHHSPPKG